MREEVIKLYEAKLEEVKALTGDNKELLKAINELVSLKGQADIIPTEVDIPVESVIKRYKLSDAVEIVRCKTAIFLHTTCYWVISKPTMANNGNGGALFEMLTFLCNYLDNRESYPKEQQEAYDALVDFAAQDLMLPLDVFTDIDFCIELSRLILHKRVEYYEKLADKGIKEAEDTIERVISEQEFYEEVKEAEQISKEIKELPKKRKSRKNDA